MLKGCSSWAKIDASNFNIKIVSNIKAMFYGYSSLKEINLSNFNTQNVANMNAIFYGCSSLKNINNKSKNILNNYILTLFEKKLNQINLYH